MIICDVTWRRIRAPTKICGVMAVWMVMITVVFDKFAYHIDAFDARSRVIFTTGHQDVREFSAAGLPISYSARNGEKYISPFYVVHYGLMYSRGLSDSSPYKSAAWISDDSVKYWNVPPKVYGEKFFKNCADWVVAHLSEKEGKAHLLYDFDWSYRNYPNGGLRAPWWSGLTDGYAIVLLLRANDVYGGTTYIRAATALYKSVLSPVAEGGSLSYLNGKPWIEEYVDPRADPKKLSFVLNGMIYATQGVQIFEKYTHVKQPVAPQLYQSIADNLHVFDMGNWSEYDAIGNASNIKYHQVHVALLDNLISNVGSDGAIDARRRWKFGMENAGFYWVASGYVGVAKLQFIVEYFLCLLLFPACILFFLLRRRRLTAQALK